jgi:hypothetical protein
MIPRSGLRATLIAGAAFLLLAPAVLADTCCANLPVGLDPRSAMPGDVVRVVGLRCLNADNTGPLPVKVGAFWLAKGERTADADPESAPGPGLPAELPPIERWLHFATVPDPTKTVGDATIKVPDLPNGTYQLWWWCDDGSGPGGGIHYSTGPRLPIGGSPDTDTAIAVTPGSSGSSGWPAGLAFGIFVFVWIARWGPFRSSHAKASLGAGSHSGSK